MVAAVPAAIRPDHVAIYIRWSTEDQGEGTTLEVQREGCRHYVLSQGWQVRDDLIYIDDGFSGGSLKRPAITSLRGQVATGAVDCVVVFKLDRLSRSVLDTVNLVLDEWEGRCYVKSAREPIDTTTPAGKLFFYMLLSYAEWERSVIKERTFSGKVRRAREGRVPGRCPYGYTPGNTPGRVTVVPAEAEVVRRIYARYAQGEGVLTIAQSLNRLGVPGPRGGGWTRSTVTYVLKNPLYKGEVAFCRRSRNHRRERDPRQPYYVWNPAPIRAASAGAEPLVDPDLWQRVQERLTARHRRAVPPRALESDHLLTGLLRCRCGHSLTGARPHGRPYYVCSAVREQGRHACAAAWIPQAAVDPVVVGAVRERYAPAPRPLQHLGRHLPPDLPGGRTAPAAGADPWATLARREQKEILRHLLAAVELWQPRGCTDLHVSMLWRSDAPVPPAGPRNPAR